jgi:hypothetical protein
MTELVEDEREEQYRELQQADEDLFGRQRTHPSRSMTGTGSRCRALHR